MTSRAKGAKIEATNGARTLSLTLTMPATPLHLDPEVAAMFNGDDTPVSPQVEEWRTETRAVYVARKKIEGEVRGRIDRALTLTCTPHDTLQDVYHVEGGTDPDGHTVDLRAEWGLQCTCGSHMMAFALCKHMIRVLLERGEALSDAWPSFAAKGASFRPGIFSRAVQVDLENAARKAATDTQQAEGGA